MSTVIDLMQVIICRVRGKNMNDLEYLEDFNRRIRQHQNVLTRQLALAVREYTMTALTGSFTSSLNEDIAKDEAAIAACEQRIRKGG